MPNHVKNNLFINGDAKQVEELFDSITIEEKNEKGKPQRFISFNTLIPMPETLKVCSGGPSGTCFRVYLKNLYIKNKEEYKSLINVFKDYNSKQVWDHEKVELKLLSQDEYAEKVEDLIKSYKKEKVRIDPYDPVLESEEDIIEYGAKIAKNIKLYCYTDWYNWCINYWGTKWDAYDQTYNFKEKNGEASCEISFCTAWSIPEPFYRKMYDIIHEKYNKISMKITFADEDLYGCMGEIIDINTITGKLTGRFYDAEEDEEEAADFYNQVW